MMAIVCRVVCDIHMKRTITMKVYYIVFDIRMVIMMTIFCDVDDNDDDSECSPKVRAF